MNDLETRVANTEMAFQTLCAFLKETTPITIAELIERMSEEHFNAAISLGSPITEMQGRFTYK